VRITRSVCKFAAVALLCLIWPLPVLAQDDPATAKKSFGPRVNQGQAAAGAPPPSEVIGTHGAWQLQCGAAQAADGSADPAGKKKCGMVQVTRNEKNAKVALSLVIVKAKQNEKDVTMMQLMVPIGVYLPTGVALEIDGEAVGRVPFTRCRPQICEAFAEASPPTLEKLKKGGTANFIIYEAPGLGMPMKISLEGFSAALDQLNEQ
jgi:invasion protein IalB